MGAEDVKGIVFIQKGYWINIDSTHEVDVAISKSGVLALTLPIKVYSFCQLLLCLLPSTFLFFLWYLFLFLEFVERVSTGLHRILWKT